jgi:hypothetical protein
VVVWLGVVAVVVPVPNLFQLVHVFATAWREVGLIAFG